MQRQTTKWQCYTKGERSSRRQIRINQLDYLKCIFILLMIIFHLVYIGDKYPYLKQVVYTFHMPAFFIISGYLLNVDKGVRSFCNTMLWMFIPYAVMETGYVCMSSVLPVREKVEEVSLNIILYKIFVAPIGPYWYLHTLLICSLVYYTLNRLCEQLNRTSFLLILGVCFWGIAFWTKILSLANAVYFIAGVAICQSRQNFLSVFQPSAIAIIPFILLSCFPENLDRSTLAGVVITYVTISFLLFLHKYIPAGLRKISYFVGRNTFPILLFSPLFTILSRLFIPLFLFDTSGICFMCVAVCFVVLGCLSLARLADKTGLSRFLVGKEFL